MAKKKKKEVDPRYAHQSKGGTSTFQKVGSEGMKELGRSGALARWAGHKKAPPRVKKSASNAPSVQEPVA